LPVSDFATNASVAGGTFRGELTNVDSTQQPIDRRKYKRIHLEALGALVLSGSHYEGPCDVSRSGVGIITPICPAEGAPAGAWLPPEDGEPAGLELEGTVARSRLVVEPKVVDGERLRTLHCFGCGWTGYVDPASGQLRTTLERAAEGSFGGNTRVGEPMTEERPHTCPTCGAGALSSIDRAYHAVGIDLSKLAWRDEERLLRYIEVVLRRRAELGRRQHKRFLLDYVPAQVRCTVDDPKALAAVFLEDIGQGGIGFVTPEEYDLGQEIRVALATRVDAEGFVMPAHIVSRTVQGGGIRYGARFARFDHAAKLELRTFIDFASGDAVENLVRSEAAQEGRATFTRQLLIGGAVGLAVGLAVAILLAIR
jgi:hypothetical protein